MVCRADRMFLEWVVVAQPTLAGPSATLCRRSVVCYRVGLNLSATPERAGLTMLLASFTGHVPGSSSLQED